MYKDFQEEQNEQEQAIAGGNETIETSNYLPTEYNKKKKLPEPGALKKFYFKNLMW